jgi:hypothetical protein
MANERRQFGVKFDLVSLFQWTWDRVANNWPGIIIFVGGSGLMTWLASLTEWAKWLGPLGWVLIAIIAMLIFNIALLLWGVAADKRLLRHFTRAKIEAKALNIMAPSHDFQRLNVSDFYHPQFLPTQNVRFTDCELLGPANLALQGNSHVDGVIFVDCDVIIVRPDRPIRGAVVFSNPTILRGRLVRITFLMNHTQWTQMPQEFRTGVPVISDGRIGDV